MVALEDVAQEPVNKQQETSAADGLNEQMKDMALATNKLQDMALATNKLQDMAIATNKLQDMALATNKLQDVALATNKLQEDTEPDEVENENEPVDKCPSHPSPSSFMLTSDTGQAIPVKSSDRTSTPETDRVLSNAEIESLAIFETHCVNKDITDRTRKYVSCF